MSELRFVTDPSVPQAFLELTLRRRPTHTVAPPFPEAVGVLDPAPARADRLAAYRRVLSLPSGTGLPVLYPHVMSGRLHLAMLGLPDFPFSMLGAVHTRTHVARYAPLPAEGAYTLRTWFDGERAVKSGLEFSVATDLHLDGEVVWSSRNAYQVRGRFGEAEPAPPEADLEAPEGGRQTAQWSLPSSLGRSYARVCGDWNPIHITRWSAKAFGFKRNIVHGYANLAMALDAVGVPDGPVRLDVAFKGPVYLDGRAWASADGDGRFAVHSPSDDRPAIVGRITQGMPDALHAPR